MKALGTMASAINAALHKIFDGDERVHLVGEDLLDPYGGAFKIGRGLSTRWPERVLTTPISEAAIVGVCAGMALRGLRPVAEIMFGDFISLAFDQLLNHATKFGPMYNGQASCPLVVRTPMGGGRGYGPTHSQSLEKYLVGIPGLHVVAPGPAHDIERFYRHAITESDAPTVIVEHKLLYGAEMIDTAGRCHREFQLAASDAPYATVTLSLTGFRRADVLLVTYGGGIRTALDVARRMLLEHEIVVEVAVLGSLAPLPVEDLDASVVRARRVVVLEEGTGYLGIGAEVAATLSERHWGRLLAPVGRVAALDAVIPAARHLEDAMLPNAARLEAALLKATGCRPIEVLNDGNRGSSTRCQ